MTEQHAMELAEMAPKIMAVFHDLNYRQPTEEQLTMRQYQAMIILNVYGRLAISELCEKLNLAASTGTELVNRMLETQYFAKSEEGSDKRKILLSVTPKGHAVLERRKQAVSERFVQVLKSFTDTEQMEFVHSFKLIMKLLGKYQQKQSLTEKIPRI